MGGHSTLSSIGAQIQDTLKNELFIRLSLNKLCIDCETLCPYYKCGSSLEYKQGGAVMRASDRGERQRKGNRETETDDDSGE